MFNKKNLPIIISVSFIILIIIASLFYYIFYFNEKIPFQISDEKQRDEERQKILMEEKIEKEIIELAQFNKKYNILKPTPKLIQKQTKELDKIYSRY